MIVVWPRNSNKILHVVPLERYITDDGQPRQCALRDQKMLALSPTLSASTTVRTGKFYFLKLFYIAFFAPRVVTSAGVNGT